jgi:nucleoside-diphosphate-sugar epimerase
MPPKVILIGGTGFLGTFAVREMRQRGWEVTSVGLAPVPREQNDDPQVHVVEQDFTRLDDPALLALLRGHTALVFAAGADDRLTPNRPCYPFFKAANVDALERLLRLAKPAGITRAVALGSYFTYFNRQWPHLKLTERHPYIRSRVEQQRVAFAAAAPEIELSFLELPYIFGAAPNRLPLWAPLLDYLRSTQTIYYTRGGTACVSVKAVGQAIAGAVEKGRGGQAYPIGEVNLTWGQMLTRLAKADGRDIRVVSLPNALLDPALWGLWLVHRLQGKESGLDPRHLLDLQAAETFFDPAPAQAELGFENGLLEGAFAETVAACPPKTQKRT